MLITGELCGVKADVQGFLSTLQSSTCTVSSARCQPLQRHPQLMANWVCCRPMVQVPLGYSPIAVIHSIPNISDNVLQLNPLVLAGIFQCQVTTWNDVSIAALNPNLT